MKDLKKYLAEMVGALGLTLVVLLVLQGSLSMLAPFFAALTLGLFVYSIGPISGAHLNPAITLAALSIKKIELKDAVAYIVAQFIGAGLALLIGQFVMGLMDDNRHSSLVVAQIWSVGFGEFLGAFFFAFGVASVIYGKTPRDASGIVVGGSLLIGLSLASILSNGILNPAVAMGIQSFNLMYLLGPIVGAVAGMWAYKAVNN